MRVPDGHVTSVQLKFGNSDVHMHFGSDTCALLSVSCFRGFHLGPTALLEKGKCTRRRFFSTCANFTSCLTGTGTRYFPHLSVNPALSSSQCEPGPFHISVCTRPFPHLSVHPAFSTSQCAPGPFHISVCTRPFPHLSVHPALSTSQCAPGPFHISV